jgi:hypothetical protein
LQITNHLLLYEFERAVTQYARLPMDTFNYLTDHWYAGGCCDPRPEPPPPGAPLQPALRPGMVHRSRLGCNVSVAL